MIGSTALGSFVYGLFNSATLGPTIGILILIAAIIGIGALMVYNNHLKQQLAKHKNKDTDDRDLQRQRERDLEDRDHEHSLNREDDEKGPEQQGVGDKEPGFGLGDDGFEKFNSEIEEINRKAQELQDSILKIEKDPNNVNIHIPEQNIPEQNIPGQNTPGGEHNNFNISSDNRKIFISKTGKDTEKGTKDDKVKDRGTGEER